MRTKITLPTAVFQHAALIGHTDDSIPSHGTTEALRARCRAWAHEKGLPSDCVLDVLQWDGMNGCFCFAWAGMFLGVETDGHIHS